MSEIKRFVTQDSSIDYYEAHLMPNRFVLLNMWPDGIWLVDMQHPDFDKCVEVALTIAKTFDDKESIEKLEKLTPRPTLTAVTP
jgi:hypothetical protein